MNTCVRFVCLTLTGVTFFGQAGFAASLASDVATVMAPASKLCMISKMASFGSGIMTAQAVESSLSGISCFPRDSSQFRAYTLLARLLYSRNYGTVIASLRAKNAGLIDYFNERLSTDNAFFESARAFYQELQESDRIFFSTKHPELMGKVSNLAQRAGQGAFTEVPAGWLWRLAMKHGGQNPVTAIELIGICGHDDVQYEPLTNGSKTASFTCPIRGGTLFYLAASLGEGTDIDSGTKTRIATIQAPHLGPAALPSKTYHIYGGALIACLIKAQGLSDAEVRASNALVARIYRGIDMRNRIVISRGTGAEDPAAFENELRESCKTQRGRFLCPDFRSASGYDQAREDRFVAGKRTEFDAYTLIDRWGMIKKMPIVGLPFDLDFNVTPTQLADRPKTWSVERFDAAVSRLRTFAVDRTWTEAQHGIGAEFALRHCGR